MKMRFALLLLFCLRVGLPVQVRAEVVLPALFSEHATLQRSPATAVWGRANPGEHVTVRYGASGGDTVTDADGRWTLSLDLSTADKSPHEFIAEGTNRIAVQDVIVGEVWLSSGQSNMQLPLNATTGGAKEAAGSGSLPLRWFVTNPTGVFLPPQEHVGGKWVKAGANSSGDCSAVAYYFGKELAGDLDTPVGLVLTAVGGTAIQSWMSREAIDADTTLKQMIAKDAPKRVIPIVTPSFYYNQLIRPLASMTLKGVVWYQGEAHFSQGEFYARAFPALIRDWRHTFSSQPLAFYYCQLPNLDKRTTDPNDVGWVAVVREAQDAGLSEPDTGEAVLIDAGEVNLHPKNKRIVGHRLTLLAEAGTYGRNVAAQSPRLLKADVDKGNITLTFSHAAGGIMVSSPEAKHPADVDQQPRGFALRDPQGHWVWADARIDQETIIVSHPAIPMPTAIRYAWGNNPVCNVCNQAGLPLAPFQHELNK